MFVKVLEYIALGIFILLIVSILVSVIGFLFSILVMGLVYGIPLIAILLLVEYITNKKDEKC